MENYAYGADRKRVMTENAQADQRTFYVWQGQTVIAEYQEPPTGPMSWSKSYYYLGSRLLATSTLDGGAEFLEFHHPDRLGTRLVTNSRDATVKEQVHLPFGTALDAESTGHTNQRFTSYDRSDNTGIDYAVNRSYHSAQGRFMQVDPMGMGATNLSNPQSLNLYAYVGNDPINSVDPLGLIPPLFYNELYYGPSSVEYIGGYWEGIGWTATTSSNGQTAYWEDHWHHVPGVDLGPALGGADLGVNRGNGGSGDGGVGHDGGTPEQYFDTLPKKCQDALRKYEDALNRANETTRFYNVDLFSDLKASYFVTFAPRGVTVGQWFDSYAAGAVTVWGRQQRQGVYYRGSRAEIDPPSPGLEGLRLHELMHTVVRGDEGTLTSEVGIPQPPIPYSHSWANSQYFNSGCSP